MNEIPFLPAALVAILGLVQIAWYIAVIVLLVRIWMKVKNLPT